MQNRRIYILLVALLPLCFYAQGQEAATQRRSSGAFTGFSGGMMLHGGYLFADSPDRVFSNSGLGSLDYVKALPRDGFCYGLGGALRVHLINHFHIGAEGFVSTLPLMRTGSNVRSGWGGVFCDAYLTLGRVRPLLGVTIGGGTMKRLYVPEQNPGVDFAETDSTYYNASYTKTPFFLVDPYVGLEISLATHMSLIIRIDYMLPFGNAKTELVTDDTGKWTHFMSPSGPRLYIGVMFGKLQR